MSENTSNTANPLADGEVGTDVAVSVRSDPRSIIAALNNGEVSLYSSFKVESHADKLAVLKALTDTVPLDEHLGEIINLQNVIVQAVEMNDEKTGELVTVPRTILIDADGTAYAAMSNGIMRSLENVFGILGQPSEWPQPVAISVVEQKSRGGYKFFTMKMV